MSEHPHLRCKSCRDAYYFTQLMMLVCFIVGLASGGTRGIAAAILFAAMELGIVAFVALDKHRA